MTLSLFIGAVTFAHIGEALSCGCRERAFWTFRLRLFEALLVLGSFLQREGKTMPEKTKIMDALVKRDKNKTFQLENWE